MIAESEIRKIILNDNLVAKTELELMLVRKINLLIDETAVLKANLEHYAKRTNKLIPPPEI